jgi:polysaccharide export outer membrane protein
MRLCRFLVLLLAVLALAACARKVPRYAAPPQVQSDLDAMVYGAPAAAPQPAYHSPSAYYARPAYYSRPAYYPRPTAYSAPSSYSLRPSYTQRRVAEVIPVEGGPYTLDAGDKLRIVVFGQDTLSNTYQVDAAGMVTMPLIGGVTARGLTTAQLSGAIAGRLKQNFIRDPSVAVEVDTYRPFFVLGEVTYPGQYPYVPNMTVEKAVAIAGGFTPRANKRTVTVTRPGGAGRYSLPLQYPLRPGDTITVSERWF